MTTAVLRTLAFVRRDAVVELTYPVALLIGVLDIALGVLAFFYLGRLFGGRPDGYAPRDFLVVGLAANGALSTALVCFVQAIQGARASGELAVIVAAPVRPSAILVYGSAYPIARALLEGGSYLVAGMLLGVRLTGAASIATMMTWVLSVGAFAAFGMFSGVAAVALRRGDPVAWLMGAASWLLGGVFFPPTLLPPVLQWAASVLPMTHATGALRSVMLRGAGIHEVGLDLLILGGWSVLAIAVAMPLFSAAIHRERVRGTLLHR